MSTEAGQKPTDYSNYFFDLDGTLVNSAPEILDLLTTVLKEFDQPVPVMDNTLVGPVLKNIVTSVCPRASEALRASIVVRYRQLYREGAYKKSRLFPGVVSLLRKLHAEGRTLFVATNKPEDVTRLLLDNMNILPLFADIACSDSIPGTVLSKGEMLNTLLKRHGVDPDQSLMTGDSAYDLLGAKEAGMSAMAALYGYGRREILLEIGPDFIADDPAWRRVTRYQKK